MPRYLANVSINEVGTLTHAHASVRVFSPGKGASQPLASKDSWWESTGIEEPLEWLKGALVGLIESL